MLFSRVELYTEVRKILLGSLFSQLLSNSSSSAKWNYPKLLKYCPMILFPFIPRYFEQFAWMEQPWTLEILSYYPSSLNYSVVQAVQQGWTIHWTHEMFYYDPCFLNYSVVRAVRLGGTTLNSWIIVLWFFFPQLLASSSDLKGLNYSKLMKCSLWSLFSQLLSNSSSSAKWNYHKLLKYCPMILVPFIPRYIEQFAWMEQPWTHERLSYYPLPELLGSSSSSTELNYTPNLWNVLLRFLFPQLHGSSSSSACFIKPTHMGHYTIFLIPLITR